MLSMSPWPGPGTVRHLAEPDTGVGGQQGGGETPGHQVSGK